MRLGEVHLGWEAGVTAKARRRAAHGVGVLGREASRARGTLAQHQGGLVFNETRGAKAGLAEGSARGRPGGRAGGETATNGVSRRGREMEMVVMAVL